MGIYPAESLAEVPAGLGYLARSTGVTNTTMMANVFRELPNLSLRRLSRKRRPQVIAALRRPELELGYDHDLLLAQGWRVAHAANDRVGHPLASSERAHRREMELRLDHPGYFAITAAKGGHLGGYMQGYAVGSTGYLISNCLDEQGLSWRVGALLYWLSFCVLANTPGVESVHLGHWFPESPQVEFFKRTLDAHVEVLPAAGRLNPVVGRALAVTRPVKYIRIGGCDSGVRAKYGIPEQGILR
jgi:hypothetical protein